MSVDDCTAYYPDQLWSFGPNMFGPCSGNGVCVNGTCQCDPGWTGLSDWVNADGFDCQIYMPGYKATWGALLALQVYAVVASLPYLRARRSGYLDIKKKKQAKGEKYGLMQNRGALGMVLWYLVGVPLLVTMCITKLVWDEERIGITWFVSILYCAIRSVFYLCYVLFQPSLLEAVLHGSKKTSQFVVANRHVSYMFFLLQLFAAFLPFIALAKPELQQQVFLISSFTIFLTGVWIPLQALYIQKKVVKTLDQSYEMAKNEKTLVMKEKLIAMQKVPMKQGPIAAIIQAFMFIWPFLWTKHDYILALTWVVFVMTGLKTAKTSVSDAENKSMNSSSISGSDGSNSTGPQGFSSDAASHFDAGKDKFLNMSTVAVTSTNDEDYV